MVLRAEGLTTSLSDATLTVWLDSTTAIQVTAAEGRQALRGQARNDPDAIAAIASDLLNKKTRLYQPIADLPDDDPDKTTDPDNFPTVFWADADLERVTETGAPVAFLASGVRSQITVVWTGTAYRINQVLI